MPNFNSNMRLFKGHLKLDEQTLTNLFLEQLGNIYWAKSHLAEILPTMSAKASFPELKDAISEGVGKIKMQMLRMAVIYQTFGMEYSDEKAEGIKSIMLEAETAIGVENKSPLLVDMSILTHLRIIESIEITSFKILQDIATSLKNTDVQTLLNQNVQSALDTQKLFELISQEYIF